MEIEKEPKKKKILPQNQKEEVKTNETREKTAPSNFLSLRDKCKAFLDFQEGINYSTIARNINRNPRTIKKLVDKANCKGSLDNQHSQKGRYPKGSTKLTDEHKRFILKWIEEGSHNSSNEIWIHLCSIKTLKKVAYTSMNNYLKTLGRWVKPRLSIAISEKNLGSVNSLN